MLKKPVLFFLISIGLQGCNSETPEPKEPTIVGEWEIEKRDAIIFDSSWVYENTYSYVYVPNEVLSEFNANGEWRELRYNLLKFEGTYTHNGNKLTCHTTSGTEDIRNIENLTETSFVLRDTTNDDNKHQVTVVTFKRL